MTRKNGRNTDGTFAEDNPGKPRGARHKATRAVEDLLQGEAEGLTRKAVDMALEGDTTALRLCLERVSPPRKDAPVQFDLPVMESAHDAAEAAQRSRSSGIRSSVLPFGASAGQFGLRWQEGWRGRFCCRDQSA